MRLVVIVFHDRIDAEAMSRRDLNHGESSARGGTPDGPRLSDELVELVESGVSMLVGTCDAAGRPEAVRGLGARVSEDRRRVTVMLNAALAARTRDNLLEHGRLAVAFSRIFDHRTIQLKGHVVSIRDGDPGDHALQERYVVAFAEQVSLAGLPRSVVRNVRLEPCLVVELEVDALFEQTPGPRAGEALSS